MNNTGPRTKQKLALGKTSKFLLDTMDAEDEQKITAQI